MGKIERAGHEYPISEITYRGVRYSIPADLDLLRQRVGVISDLSELIADLSVERYGDAND